MQFQYSLALVAAVASSLLVLSPAHAADLQPMTYDGLKKIIGRTQGDVAKTAPQVVGKTLTVKLTSSNDALFVNAKDGVYFTCDKRAAALKSGSMTTTVTKYGLTPDGDVSVALENCR